MSKEMNWGILREVRLTIYLQTKKNMNLDRNPFSPLFDIIECFYYHNFGHNSHECQLKKNRSKSQNNCRTNECIQWRKKKKENEFDKCGLVLYAEGQNNKWYVDNGFSGYIW